MTFPFEVVGPWSAGREATDTASVTEKDPGGSRERHWSRVYASSDEQAVSWFAPTPAVSLELLDAVGVGPDRSVIDIGAGASRLVDALLERGHTDVAALDVTGTGLAVSRARLGPAAGRVRWIVADVLDWRPPRRFDVWHDRAVFHFLTDPADRDRYRAVLDDTVAAAGAALVGTFAADGPQACSGLPTVGYTVDQLHEALGGPRRWQVRAARRECHTTPWGANQPFTWIAVTRAP